MGEPSRGSGHDQGGFGSGYSSAGGAYGAGGSAYQFSYQATDPRSSYGNPGQSAYQPSRPREETEQLPGGPYDVRPLQQSLAEASESVPALSGPTARSSGPPLPPGSSTGGKSRAKAMDLGGMLNPISEQPTKRFGPPSSEQSSMGEKARTSGPGHDDVIDAQTEKHSRKPASPGRARSPKPKASLPGLAPEPEAFLPGRAPKGPVEEDGKAEMEDYNDRLAKGWDVNDANKLHVARSIGVAKAYKVLHGKFGGKHTEASIREQMERLKDKGFLKKEPPSRPWSDNETRSLIGRADAGAGWDTLMQTLCRTKEDVRQHLQLYDRVDVVESSTRRQAKRKADEAKEREDKKKGRGGGGGPRREAGSS